MIAIQATKKAIQLQRLLKELGRDRDESIPIYINNQSYIILVKNSEYYTRIKYIDIQYYFIREKVKDN